MTTALPRLSVIGAGHLGRSLARLWNDAGVYSIADVVARQQAHAQEAVKFIGAGRALSVQDPLQPAEVFLIATPDSNIEEAARQLAASGLMTADTLVFHCSGALASNALGNLAPALVASVHPIRSFAQPEQAVAMFEGTWCGAEGERAALDRLLPAFTAIGARVVEVAASKKVLYHAAAVIGSNYLVTLVEAALQAYEAAGIARADALQMLHPLAEGALGNALRVGPAQALSGPIARGDWDTVRSHEQALQAVDPGLAEFYHLMAERTGALKRDQEGTC